MTHPTTHWIPTTPYPRLFTRPHDGEIQIETPPGELWTARLDAWKRDHSLPCPAPEGHLMFEHPQDYRGHAWWIVSDNLYVMTNGKVVVNRYGIIGAHTVCHQVLEPVTDGLDGRISHRSYTSLSQYPWPDQARYYGGPTSRDLPPLLDCLVLPYRASALLTYAGALASVCATLIHQIYPYTRDQPHDSSGCIAIVDPDIRKEVERAEQTYRILHPDSMQNPA